MEKSTPVYDKDKKVMKDGLHIIFPYIVSAYEPLFYTRNEILKNKELENMFQELGFTNPYEDIVDEAVIKRNNWFMYGSCKPGKESYKITDVISYNVKDKILVSNGPEVEQSNLQLVKLFSVFDFDSECICPIKQNTDFTKVQKKIEDKKTSSETRKKIMKNKTSEDLKVIQKLVTILSPKRADNYDDWIRLGWCLHNIDYSLCETWDSFSSQSDKYKEGACQKEWDAMENRGLRTRFFARWAKRDSPEEYKNYS